MESQTFDIRRFGRVFTTELKNNFRSNAISLSLLVLIELIIIVNFNIFTLLFQGGWCAGGQGTRTFAAFVFFAMLVLVFPIRFYRHVNNPESGPFYMMIPASRFEKFLSMVLNTVVVLPAVAIPLFFGIDALYCRIDPNAGSTLWSMAHLPQLDAFFAGNNGSCYTPFLMLDDVLNLMLFFLLGAVWFKGAKLPKTVLSLIVITQVLGLLVTIPLVVLTTDLNFADTAFVQFISRHAVISDLTSALVNASVLLTALWFKFKSIKL